MCVCVINIKVSITSPRYCSAKKASRKPMER